MTHLVLFLAIDSLLMRNKRSQGPKQYWLSSLLFKKEIVYLFDSLLRANVSSAQTIIKVINLACY